MESLLSRITEAHALYDRYGFLLLRDRKFCVLLENYMRAINTTNRVMKELGITGQCYRCGRTDKGSCCAPEVAEWYDSETLFINLLMDCPLQTNGAYEGHCCFLGINGCTLLARHYFCVNFLCDTIRNSLSQNDLSMFYKTAGTEVGIQSDIMSYFFLWRKRINGVITA